VAAELSAFLVVLSTVELVSHSVGQSVSHEISHGVWTKQSRFDSCGGKVSFYSSQCPDLLWGPPNLPSNVYWGGGGALSPRVKLPGHEADHSSISCCMLALYPEHFLGK
jgi:hypothetical protein